MSVTRETLIDFIYDEVRMLDEGRDRKSVV